jgi:mono/diheme cytochrome c family protein
MYPPLAGNMKVTGPSKDLITIVLFGLEGPIEVNGRDYNQVMPAQDYLNDNQISGILSYIRSSWGNKASPVSPAEIATIRKKGKPAN